MVSEVLLNLVALIAAIFFSGISLLKGKERFVVPYALILPISIYLFLTYGTAMPALVMVLSVISTKFLYSRLFFFFGMVILVISVILEILQVSQGMWRIFDLSIGIGISLALITDKQSLHYVNLNDQSKGTDRGRELRRDMIQILAGLVLLVILYYIGQNNSRVAISLVVIMLYMFGNYYSLFPDTRIGKTLAYFERPTTPLGMGAIWFAAGMMIAFGIVQSLPILVLIVFVTTIGDPLATLFGSTIKSPKLLYNRKKSLAGFMGMFVFSAIFGYALMGFMGVGLSFISAIVESLSLHPLDDNFALPVVIGAISLLI